MVALPKYHFNANVIILILLGLLAVTFPIISTVTVGIGLGFIFLFVALFLFVTAANFYRVNRISGIFTIILAIISIIISALMIFKPEFVSAVMSIIIYLAGIILIINGIMNIFGSNRYPYMRIAGIINFLFGIAYILVGFFVSSPTNLGFLIGIWLVISGIMEGFKNPNEIIDV